MSDQAQQDTIEELKEEDFKIPIDELFPIFEEHLKIKNNHRILFSGKFGIGKTYFINEFFNNKKEEYEVFHLFPVNYQISSNDHIIEFLKYDILVELLKKNKDIFQKNDYASLIDLQRLLYIWSTDKKNIKNIFKTGVSLIPKLGKPLKEIIDLTENFWKFKKEIEAGEKGYIDSFLENLKKKNISETDYLSELLKDKIKKQKAKKQSVLILDDLDRIDPEHIFRILNIFSAHFDLHNNELVNKFGFDEIIIVADIQNLRSIFHHRYGGKTDSRGYFDKFFSFEVFQFKNEEIITKIVNQIISKFQFKTDDLIEALEENGYLKIFLENIFKESLKLTGEEKLNLWQLLKGIKFPLPAFQYGNYKEDKFASPDKNHIQFINISIKALISIFSGLDMDLLTVLKKIKSNIDNIKIDMRATDTFAYALLNDISPFEENEGSISHGWNGYSIDINNQAIAKVTKRQGSRISNTSELFIDLLIEYVSQKKYDESLG